MVTRIDTARRHVGEPLDAQQPDSSGDGTPAEAPSLETDWTVGYGRRIGGQNRFNDEIMEAAALWPELDPLILKSILAQESGFEPVASNRGGYAGIAQLGVAEARSQGLFTGQSRMRDGRRGLVARVDPRDERLEPRKAIPAAAGVLERKASSLDRGLRLGGVRHHGFGDLGRPQGDDYWRFLSAAYNAGEGTILRAIRYAYGDTPPEQVRWSDVVAAPGGDVRESPLFRAIVDARMNGPSKYREVAEYAENVVRRARQP